MPEALLKKWLRNVPGAQTVDVFGLLRPGGIQAEVGSVGVGENAKVKHVGAKRINTKTEDIRPPQHLQRHLKQLPAPATGGSGLFGWFGLPAMHGSKGGGGGGGGGGASSPALPHLGTSLDADAPEVSRAEKRALDKRVTAGSIKAGDVYSL
eukprot:TRINITY_DN14293_c0_g1_i1.p1 TRINITY_DN14293_c0_g1~~TRINITY_DN14293_c0_g1_i1.p1  ORF type:complete len:152 (+),score=26.54 TRINITY_DN14293_c0_g1_i1:76-531(+)